MNDILKLREMLETAFLAVLPRGSGVGYDWKFTWFNNGSFAISNSFHCRNHDGFDDGHAPFTLRFFNTGRTLREFELQFNGEYAQRRDRKYMLREYLGTLIADSLPSAVTVPELIKFINKYLADGAAVVSDTQAEAMIAALSDFRKADMNERSAS